MPTAGEARLGKASKSKPSSGKPGPPVKRRQAKGKENIGAANVEKSSTVKRNVVRKSKPAPNFSKLHKNWESQLSKGKAVTKKPNTKIEAFDLCGGKESWKSFATEDREEGQFSKAFNEKDDQGIMEGVVDHLFNDEDFQIDNNALQGILSNRGIQPEDLKPQGCATIAAFPLSTSASNGSSAPPARVQKRISIYYTGPRKATQYAPSPLKPHNPQVVSSGVKKHIAWADGEIAERPSQHVAYAAPRHRHQQQEGITRRDSIYYTGPKTVCSTRMTPPMVATTRTTATAHAQRTGYCPTSTLVGVQGENKYELQEMTSVKAGRPAGTGAESFSIGSVFQSPAVSRSLLTPGRAKQIRTQAFSQSTRWADVFTPQRTHHQHATPLEPLREETQSGGNIAVREQAPMVSMTTTVPDYLSATPGDWSELRDHANSPNSDPKMALCFDDVTPMESSDSDALATLEKQAMEDLRLLEIEQKRKDANTQEKKLDPQSVFSGDARGESTKSQAPKVWGSAQFASTNTALQDLQQQQRVALSHDVTTTAQSSRAEEMPPPVQRGAVPNRFTTPGRRQKDMGRNPPPAVLDKERQTPQTPLIRPRTVYPLTPGGLNRDGFCTPGETFGYPSARYVTRTGSCVRVVNTSVSTPLQTKFPKPGIGSATSTTDRESAFLDSSRNGVFVTHGTSTATPIPVEPAESISTPFQRKIPNPGIGSATSTTDRESAVLDSSRNGVFVTHGTLTATPIPVKLAKFAKPHPVRRQADPSDSLAKTAVHCSSKAQESAAMPPSSPLHDNRPVQIVSPTRKSPTRKRATPQDRPNLSLRRALPISETSGNSLRSGDHMRANFASRYRWDVPTENPSAFRSVSGSRRPLSEGFQDALLDMEVTMVTSLQRSRYKTGRDLTNPLARLFLEGDSQCFVPIEE